MGSTKHNHRPVKTQAEEALERYVFARNVVRNGFATDAADSAASEIRAQLTLSRHESYVALRDFAQYRLAQMADEKVREAQAKINEMSDQLAANHAKLPKFPHEGD